MKSIINSLIFVSVISFVGISLSAKFDIVNTSGKTLIANLAQSDLASPLVRRDIKAGSSESIDTNKYSGIIINNVQ